MSSSSPDDGRPSGLPSPDSTRSFWHSEPNGFLLGHRTTEELPGDAHIVVVGSGISGASIVRWLAEDERAEGLRVVLLEAREVCWGATGRNGGHCQPLLLDRSRAVAAFELENVAAVKSYVDTHAIPCEWRDVSGCRTFWTPALVSAALADVARLRRESPELGRLVRVVTDEQELRTHRVVGAAGATLTQGAASLWPYKYVAAVVEKCVRDGKVNLQTWTPVESIAVGAGGKAGVYTLHTRRGSITAPTVILATNGYTSHILPSFSDLIVPVRGEMSALLPPKGSCILPDSYGFIGTKGQSPNCDDYLVQRPFSGVPSPAGHLMFGGGRGTGKLECIGVSDDDVIDEDCAAYLRRTLLEVLDLGGETEGTQELRATHQWTGIMGYSRDNHPWVGGVPGMKGLWLCGGYTGHGMPNATLCGRAVVEMVLAEREGKDAAQVQETLIREGGLPAEYLLTQKRVERARSMPTVAAADEMGLAGNDAEEPVRHAKAEAKL